MRLWYAVSVLFFLATSAVFSANQYALEWHVHTSIDKGGFSDGSNSPEEVIQNSLYTIIVFSDHLDGIVKKGVDLYLDTIRCLSGRDGTLAIPAAEITCGYDYAAYDVIVLGLTRESLDELASLFNRGAFRDPETGLPALKLVAEKYRLILIAAHPDSEDFLMLKGIPFHLKENSKYVNGYEVFDSKHIGFDEKRFPENCIKCYEHTNQVIVPAGSDFHFGTHGAIPTTSWKEAPVTMVVLDDGVELTEDSVVEAFRAGQVYATSIRGSRLAVSSVIPGRTWDRESNLVMACAGLEESDLLYDQVNVVCASRSKWYSRSYRPQYLDGMLALNLSSDQIPSDVTSINVDFGGRLLTSTIFVKPVTPVVQLTQALVSAESAEDPAVSKSADLTAYKHHFKWTFRHGIGLAEWEIGVNDDFKGKVRFCPLAGFSPVVRDIELKPNGGCWETRIPFTYDETMVADVPNDFQALVGGPNTLQRKVRFYTGEWNAPLGTVSQGELIVLVGTSYRYAWAGAQKTIGLRFGKEYLDGYARHDCQSSGSAPYKY